MMKIIKPVILLFWIAMLGLLIHRTYLAPSRVIAISEITKEGLRTGDEWSGIYQNGRKIGYAHTSMVREGDAYHLMEESELELLVLGSVQRVKTVINSYTTRNFLLKYFTFTMQSQMSTMEIKGVVIDNKLVLDIMSAGRSRKERIPLKQPPYLSPNIKPALVLMGLEPGRKYRFPMLNPSTMNIDEALVTVESTEKIKVGDRETAVYKLKETFQGMEAFSWITAEGETIKEESPLGYVLLKETMEEAKKADKRGPAVDIISLVMIPSRRIENPAQTAYLKARLAGATLRGFSLDGGSQSLTGDDVEIRVPSTWRDYDIPYPEKDHDESLAATALVQSDDEKIRRISLHVTAGVRSAVEAAKKLNEWVYHEIEKKPVVSIPSAVEVLDQKVGDCNEHTTLYTALARAAGIPARMAAGIVYFKDGFYYHAWPEVWLGQWVAVDPTFNQFPADATHIRFITGNLDRQSEILKLIGKLEVKVLEYK